MSFIMLTTYGANVRSQHESLILNTKHIEEVKEEGEGSIIILLDNGQKEFRHVLETVEEIYEMLSR